MLSKIGRDKCTSAIQRACTHLTMASSLKKGAQKRKDERIKQRVMSLLQLYDPENVAEADNIILEWKGKSSDLIESLHEKYRLTDVGLAYFKTKYSRLYQLPSVYDGTFCRQCLRRTTGEARLYHRLYKKSISQFTIHKIQSSIHLLRKLSHPNIIKLHDVFESRTRIVFITDMLDYEKCNLITKLRSQTKLSESNIASYFIEICSILQYLESKHLIHGDIDANSFCINNDNKVVLIRVDQCSHSCRPFDQRYVSDQRFASPEMYNLRERVNSNVNITQSTDIWSLGVLLYLMLSGSLPMHHNKQMNLHKNEHCWTQLSFHSRDLCMKMLEKDTKKRYEIADILKHPWIVRYKMGYLSRSLWNGYSDNLRKYECVEKMRNGIKKLLKIQSTLGMFDGVMMVDTTRTILSNWARKFESQHSEYTIIDYNDDDDDDDDDNEFSQYQLFVPLHIKELIVDFA